MGMALADAALRRGAQVTVIAANSALPVPAGAARLDVETTEDLARAVSANLGRAHVLLMAAAPADFRPAEVRHGKVRRQTPGLDLHLEPTEDILAAAGAARRPEQTIVGFAAEHGEGGLERAREKLDRKGADLIVLNDVSDPEIGFDSSRNAVTLVTGHDEQELSIASKDEIAEAILDRVEAIRQRGHGSEDSSIDDSSNPSGSGAAAG
jgi:phosphopantothenoylcysteine decarboxylase/phosphopantothenate--cysteine ligase